MHARKHEKIKQKGKKNLHITCRMCYECVPYSDRSCPIPAAAAMSTGCALAVWKWSLQVLLLVRLRLCVWARRLTAAHRRSTVNSSSGARPAAEPNTSKSAELGSNVVQDQGKVLTQTSLSFSVSLIIYLINKTFFSPPASFSGNVPVCLQQLMHSNLVSFASFFTSARVWALGGGWAFTWENGRWEQTDHCCRQAVGQFPQLMNK